MQRITKIVGGAIVAGAIVLGFGGYALAAHTTKPVAPTTQSAAPTPEPESTPTETAPTQTYTPEDTFWAYVQANTDSYPESSRDAAVTAGESTCDAFDTALATDFSVAYVLGEMTLDADTEVVVTAAAINLCSEYASDVQAYFAGHETDEPAAEETETSVPDLSEDDLIDAGHFLSPDASDEQITGLAETVCDVYDNGHDTETIHGIFEEWGAGDEEIALFLVTAVAVECPEHYSEV